MNKAYVAGLMQLAHLRVAMQLAEAGYDVDGDPADGLIAISGRMPVPEDFEVFAPRPDSEFRIERAPKPKKQRRLKPGSRSARKFKQSRASGKTRRKRR